MNLRIIDEKNNICILEWDPDARCGKYYVQGLTNIFTYITLDATQQNAAVVPKRDFVIGYRVAYVISGYDDEVLETTNTVMVDSTSTEELEPIDLYYVDAPEGYTVSFRSEKQYDLYRVYNNGRLIKETEDCLALFSMLDHFKVKAYNKNGDLVAESEVEKPQKCLSKKRSNILLSIGIPVYNSGAFLIRTMSSILASSMQDYEIIIIDDSTDEKTKEICDWYANFYSFVRVKHRKRGGICSARNYLLDNAKGEWFAFVDADDVVHPYMFEKLYKAATEKDASIAISQVIIRDDFNKSSKLLADSKFVQKTFGEIMDENDEKIFFVGTWNKIVKTEIARKVRFDDKHPYYEDIAYTPAMYSYIDKFVYVGDAYYIWDKRKRLTVGTSSAEVNDLPNDEAWKLYVKACAYCVEYGNQDPGAAEICKRYVLKLLLKKYIEMSKYSNVKTIISNAVKKLEGTSIDDPKLKKAWDEIITN